LPNVDIGLQSGWFWATSIASFTERLLDFRSCWIVFIHIVRGRPGGLLQFFYEEAVKILASVLSDAHAIWPNREKRHACLIAERHSSLVVYLTSSFCIWWYHLITNSFADTIDGEHQILSVSFLLTSQHSEPYWKMGRIQVLYNCRSDCLRFV